MTAVTPRGVAVDECDARVELLDLRLFGGSRPSGTVAALRAMRACFPGPFIRRESFGPAPGAVSPFGADRPSIVSFPGARRGQERT